MNSFEKQIILKTRLTVGCLKCNELIINKKGYTNEKSVYWVMLLVGRNTVILLFPQKQGNSKMMTVGDVLLQQAFCIIVCLKIRLFSIYIFE